LRTSDFAFRIGGDEFALVLPQTDAPQSQALSRRIETVFADTLKSLQLNVTVGMDYGVANFPPDADNIEELVRIADERLYQRKHAHRGGPAESPAQRPVEPAPAQPPVTPLPTERPASTPPPTPISIETKRTQEEAAPPAPSRGEPEGSKLSSVGKLPRTFTTPRKAERVSMTGTNAYAVLGEQGARRARVLDLGFGGVALELDSSEGLTENILAVLHVPILPPVRVNLRPVWSQRTNLGYRIGCTFVN
jgi:hypothetical protein